ncbi:putative transcriptional regulator, AsnC family [Candidatus Nitrososphaera gargensis Ga9.2]|uniref:Putative transcriptional regulator, AsnC family n=1 Tax=Nitrososphaera gargensis (strain Ga9.2) TaxID=1237085 RepID=K0IFU2_NITGG|nr:AsnC family transcriptional regulator [Candidatus Nitrososphaera gargensis]AFU60261.1 putative transcriptional regulator, AsnC family [Candidatus Nitrososphaera gargensis Ga9.2]
MPKSLMLIGVDLGADKEVLEEVRDHAAISEAYRIIEDESEMYSIIAKVESDTRDDLDAIETKIRRIEQVRSTLTLEIIEGKRDNESRPLQL